MTQQKKRATLEEARSAKKTVAKTLMTVFNDASETPVNGIGLGIDGEGHFVSVSMNREPTREETEHMPYTCDGVRVKYKVIGKIVKG